MSFVRSPHLRRKERKDGARGLGHPYRESTKCRNLESAPRRLLSFAGPYANDDYSVDEITIASWPFARLRRQLVFALASGKFSRKFRDHVVCSLDGHSLPQAIRVEGPNI